MSKFQTLAEAQRQGFALIAHTWRMRAGRDPEINHLTKDLDELVSKAPMSPDTDALMQSYLDPESMAILLGVVSAAAADFVEVVATLEGMTGEEYCQQLIEHVLWVESQ